MQTQKHEDFQTDSRSANEPVSQRRADRMARREGRQGRQSEPRGIQPRKKNLGDWLFAPTSSLARSVYWVTSPSGGGKLLFKAMASYCFLISVEAAYVAMPVVLKLSAPQEQRHFLPKPGVNDGADFSRIVDPVAAFYWVSDTALGWMPLYQKHPGHGKHYVWFDQYFWFALLASALLHGVEAKAIRNVSLSILRKKAEQLKAHKQVAVDKDSITIAHLAAKQYNQARVGNAALTALLILAVFGIEVAAFFASTDKAKYPVQWVWWAYCLLNSLGFEVFYNLSLDEAESVEQPTT